MREVRIEKERERKRGKAKGMVRKEKKGDSERKK